MPMEEIWKHVVGYEGYEVSNLGRVRSLPKITRSVVPDRYNSTRILKQSPDGKGYMMVWLYKGKKRKTMKVHRLVANAFIPNPECKPQIDHINAVKTDNRVCNLRWCTEKENSNNPITVKRNGEAHFGIKSGCNREVLQYTMNGDFVRMLESINDIERELGISHAHIVGCCKGYKYKKSAGGFIWKYANNG